MKYKLLVILVVASLMLAACGGAGAPAVPAKPSVVRIGWSQNPDSLNPGVAWLEASYTIFELVYNSMYELKLDGTFAPDLAERVSVSDDALTYTYVIKKGIKWHDGQPLTAKDIAFTYNLYLTHTDFATLNSYTEHFVSIEAPDDNTVIITVDRPVPNMESKLVFLYVLPEHIWKDHADDKAAEFENLDMIGSGPFKMEEYVANEFVRLTANKDYYGAPPKVDEVVFQAFQNPDVMIQAIKTSQVDMITEMPHTGVAALKDVPNVKVATGALLSPDLTDIIFNQVDPENCPTADGGICSGHPALRDKNVRLAMAYATDKQKLIDVVMLGFATPGIALIPDGLREWFNKDIKDFPYDVAKANKLLDDAGYKDANGDGIRDMPDGSRPLTFRLNWPGTSVVGPRMGDLLSEMWKQIGISLELQAVEDDALTAKCCPALDYDIMIWGWVADPDPNTLLIIPTTDQIPTGYNETGYSNPKYDDLFQKQGVELDHAKRKAMVMEMQKIVHDDVVYLIPFYSVNVQAYRTDTFKGWLDSESKLSLQDVSSLVVIEPVK